MGRKREAAFLGRIGLSKPELPQERRCHEDTAPHPPVNACPADRPGQCRHCHHPILHRHGVVAKPVKDHKLREVVAVYYKCTLCNKTFRHYPEGVDARDQSERTVVLAALIYGLRLSCSAASHLLRALGARIGKMTVLRNAQQAGEALRRKRPAGGVRVLGADEGVSKVKGQEVVGLMTDAGWQLGRLQQQYLWADIPKPGEKASASYRIKMLTVGLWEKWQKPRLYLSRPELGLYGTDNCTERAVGRSKARYKTMRGHKSVEVLGNAIALTQWLHNGDERHDLLEAIQHSRSRQHPMPQPPPQTHPPPMKESHYP